MRGERAESGGRPRKRGPGHGAEDRAHCLSYRRVWLWVRRGKNTMPARTAVFTTFTLLICLVFWVFISHSFLGSSPVFLRKGRAGDPSVSRKRAQCDESHARARSASPSSA